MFYLQYLAIYLQSPHFQYSSGKYIWHLNKDIHLHIYLFIYLFIILFIGDELSYAPSCSVENPNEIVKKTSFKHYPLLGTRR